MTPGASSESLSGPLSNAAEVLWSLPATATNIGTDTFTTSFDSTAGHDTLVYGSDSAVPEADIQFDPLSLTISSAATVSISSPPAQGAVTTGMLPFVFTATLSATTSQQVLVDYTTADGTATAAANQYTPTSGTLTFAPGATTATITVDATSTAFTGSSETFSVNLSLPSPSSVTLGTAISGTATVEAFPTVSISNPPDFVDGTTPTNSDVLTATLSAASAQQVLVTYSTADGSATSPTNYTGTSGTLTFAPGATTATITINVTGTPFTGTSETFSVNLSSPSNATLGTQTTALATVLPPPTVSISNPSNLVDVTAGTVADVLTATLSGPSTELVTVFYSTADGTATSPTDYTGVTSGTFTFAPGATTATISVNVTSATFTGANETFSVNLSSATNATLGAGTSALATVLPPPTVSISNPADLVDGTTGTTPDVLTATLSGPSTEQVTVVYSTADGTATSPTNYTGVTSGTFTFAPGTTSQTLTVNVASTFIDAGTETFSVNLSSAVNATLSANASATATVENPLPGITLVAPPATSSSTTAVTPFVFTVTVPASAIPRTSNVTVVYATADGTATQPTDYTPTSGTLTFAPGTTSQTITVNVTDATFTTPSETFSVNLSSPSGGFLVTSSAVATVLNPEPIVTITGPPEAKDGLSGDTPFVFTVTLTGTSSNEVDVDYTTADGTALASTNYVATSGTLTFAPNTTVLSQLVTVLATSTPFTTATETFSVNLSSPTNAILGATASAKATVDNPLPGLSIASVSENDVSTGTTPFLFTVTLAAPSETEVDVDFTTVDGSATSPGNYTATSGTLTFEAGTTAAVITVQVAGDSSVAASNETFSINLSDPTGAFLSVGSATGTILPIPAVSLSGPVSHNDVTTGTISYIFTATLSTTSDQPVTVDFTTADDTATAGTNYVATSGTLTFAPGTTSQLITVIVDPTSTVAASSEDFSVSLSAPNNAALGATSSTTGVIVPIPSVSLSGPISHNDVSTGTLSYVFTATLSATSDQQVTVDFGTADDTAIAGTNYVATSGTLTFAPGTTSQLITVIVDPTTTAAASSEDFSVSLSAPTNAVLGTTISTTGVIIPIPTVAISGPVSHNDVTTGTLSYIFTATLSAASDQAVTVDFATANDTATAGTNYVATSGTLSFAPGTTSQLITVIVDPTTTAAASSEDFSVSLSAPSNAALSSTNSSTTGDILPIPTASITAPAAQNDVTSGTLSYVFTVSLSAASDQEVTVDFATANGTATAGTNYVATNGTLTFAPGTTSQLVTVTIDPTTTIAAASETFSVSLSAPANAALATTPSATGTILPIPGVTITAPPATDSGTSQTAFVFTVALSAASDQQVTVDFTTANGTGTTAGTQYVATSGTLTFAANSTAPQLITVEVNGTTLNEATETFSVNLSSPSNAALTTGSAVGTILNDVAEPTVSIVAPPPTEAPDSGTTPFVFTVNLSAASGQAITVAYAPADGSAAAAANQYDAASGTLTFAPGTTTQNITVQVVGTLLREPDETFTVNLSSPTNTTLQTASATATIQSNPNHTTSLSSLSGTAFIDVNQDGKVDNGEKAMSGITVNLSGTSSLTSNAVNMSTTTAGDGSYSFASLDPGTYTVTFTQPSQYATGKAIIGSEPGSVSGATYTATLVSAGVQGVNNDFEVAGLKSSNLSSRLLLASSTNNGQAAAPAATPSATANVQTAAASSVLPPPVRPWLPRPRRQPTMSPPRQLPPHKARRREFPAPVRHYHPTAPIRSRKTAARLQCRERPGTTRSISRPGPSSPSP